VRGDVEVRTIVRRHARNYVSRVKGIRKSRPLLRFSLVVPGGGGGDGDVGLEDDGLAFGRAGQMVQSEVNDEGEGGQRGGDQLVNVRMHERSMNDAESPPKVSHEEARKLKVGSGCKGCR